MKINDVNAALAAGLPSASIPKHEDDNQPIIPIPPASHLLHRSLLHSPSSVVSTSNLTITLSDGTQILDACGGAAVSCLGYDQRYLAEIAQAVSTQIITIPYVHTLTYTTATAEDLAHELLDGNPHGFEKAYFVGSGSEAMDAALKFARQYFYEIGQRERVHYIARKQSYHGNTVGAMSISHHTKRKEAYTDENVLQVPNVSWVSPAHYYQYGDWRRGETEEGFCERLVTELEEEIMRVGKGRVIAFVAETLSGATMGCVPAPKGYWRGVREVCDKYGILMILDEVMCGVGRTGTFWAFEGEPKTDGVRPDLLTLGKGLGGGMSPVAAVVLGEKLCKGLREGQGKGEVRHGHTYQAHPVSCASSLAVLRILKRDGLIQRCKEIGKVVETLLRQALGGKKYVGNIRGRGTFWGVEFVRDKETREPFKATVGWGPRYQQRVFEKGVALYPGAGTVDGIKGDHVIVSPSYTIQKKELETVVSIMTEVYDQMEAEFDTSS